MNAGEVSRELESMADPAQAAAAQKFFKTGPGEYGEGDLFRGIRVPVLRAMARKYRGIESPEAAKLLRSKFHEDRLLALFLLVRLFEKGDLAEKKTVYDLYLANTRFINNWDLVDSSAMQIVGGFLFEKDRKPLFRLARSKDLWERRISVISTLYFIKRQDFDDTLRIAGLLLEDREDLIHKAVGWMLREVGNRDRGIEERFLDENAGRMPRTMLRYAIEKFPDALRRKYMDMDQQSRR